MSELVPKIDRDLVARLPRTPWVGHHYCRSRLLVLGQSHYRDTERPLGEKADRNFTVRVVRRFTQKQRHRFYTAIAVAISGQSAHSVEPYAAWQEVAFANYCPGFVCSPSEIPSRRQIEQGQQLLPILLNALAPTHILALGARLRGWLPSDPIWLKPCEPIEICGDAVDTVAWPIRNAGIAHVLLMDHPSYRGFSGLGWHGHILQFLKRAVT